ncbi:amino acid adenylation domain-containing protein [Kitasatospora sp. NPDC058162]|uniref:amino acid adenylation domain-containing protein n=1 Tax=Kitasatospora sp. NPDC058162 TaxID=3346362 RepID=UPI0036DB4E13
MSAPAPTPTVTEGNPAERNEEAVGVDSVHHPDAIGPAPAAEWYPLSSGQLAMWLVAQAGAASDAAYTVPSVYELRGELDASALRGAFEALLARHESLRTAYGVVDGVPVQRAAADAVLDWRCVSAADAAEADGAAEEFVSLGFDLAAGKLLRVLLVERSRTEHLLVVSAHHIAVDGWSLSVLIDEVAVAYRALTAGAAPALPALELQYKDYAVWQQGLLESGAFDEARSYWQGRFTDGPELLDLPADRPLPAERTFRGGVVRGMIPAESLEALKELCRTEQVTLFAGLSALLRVQLHRYTGQRDFTLGTSSLARPVPELYDQIGYYLNSIALRNTVEPGMSFRALLGAVQGTLREGLRHSAYPFDRVVRDAGAASDAHRNTLFNVLVMVGQGWGGPSEEIDGLRIRHLDTGNGHSKMDLTFFFEETPAGLQAAVEYSTELFDADRVERLLGHFRTLLDSVLREPDRAADTLVLLPAAERRLVVSGFNGTATPYPLDTPVPQLVEQQVRRTPDAVATVDERETLTFAELNARANALARTLREEHGVRPGSLVAVLMDRSVDLTAAVLAVLKAGGAYLPVSTKDPADRVAAILADSGCRVVLVRGSGTAVPGDLAVLDVTDRAALDPRTDDLPPLAGPDDPGYCIYTSGSTGMPKGVLVEHRGLVNRLRWMTDDLGLTAADVILQKTPYVFDVSVWELLLPAVIGAKQVMLRPGGESDPAAIRAAIGQHGVTTLHFVPSMLSQYLAAVDGGFDGVRSCVCSGEELDRDLADRFFAAVGAGGARLINYYGPTEATVDVTALHVADRPGPVTLGTPAPNNRLYVLGDGDEPCPVGVTGELCIAGVQVARGYLNRPELTAERFTEDPFHPGERMYRTGDLARWLPNGEILYLGRRDGQVKVRGLRIELGEIEQALREQPGVDRAVVLARRDQAGGDFLCAYVTGRADLAPQELRDGLARRLPPYMVPSHYVRTDAIPVTRNGKTDRKALLALTGARSAGGEQVAPRTELEEQLLDLWRSLLPAGPIGVTDDFFVVGGHSLSALQLSSRIARGHGVPMSLAEVFAHRTVAEQARLIEQSATVDARPATSVTPRPRAERHRLSFAQERMWFLYRLDPDSAAYNIRVLAKLDGPLDAGALHEAVRSLVARHEMLRTTYTDAGDQVFQVPRDDIGAAFEVRDLTASGVEEAREQARRGVLGEDSLPFRLEEEGPLRVVLFRVGEREHQLLVTLHHIAGDGWSLRLLMRELSVLYAHHLGEPGAARTIEAVPLPARTVDYIDYAEAVRDPAHQEAVEQDLQYWTDRLTGCPPLELPTDTPEPDTDHTAGGRASVTVPVDTARRLRELADRTSTTPFEITMSALNLLLGRLADQQDLAVGFPVVGREQLELEGVVGLFLNTLALRTDLSAATTFTDLLRQVSAGVRDAYAHQTAPFELVVERLNPVRRLDRTPVFDVLLNYLGTLREDMAIDRVAVEFDDHLFEPEAKFPLSFYVSDVPEGMHIELVHRPGLFGAERAQAMLGQLASVLAQAAEGPDRPLARYSLALPGDAHAVDLGRALERPAQPPITELIEARAAAAPERTAIRQGEDTLAYRDLVARAEAVARELAARDCGPGDVIGVTGPRGIGFVVSLLGVLRSGATAFPVDPALPQGRRRHLLSIGRPKLFVHAEEAGDTAGHEITAGLETVRTDARTGELREPASAPARQAVLAPVPADGAAYLFFTSGTTGTPRGVLGRHSGLSHFLRWQSGTFGIAAEDRCAQLTSASFDVMLRDTFLALVSGATLVVPEPTDTLGGKAVLGWLERERVTVLHAAPTVLQSWLLDAPSGARLPDLRWTFLAGEPLKAALVAEFRALFPGSGEIVNLYGPTETTMAKFAHPVPYGTLPAVLPVGSPLPQTQGLVMRDGVPCGVGEPGEIVIRTPFRTFGYLDDPEANAAAFFRNPHRDDEQDLLYRTGDIGRVRPDGLLEIIGRRDHQLKINGVRIHPAEIENALGGHPRVSACLVTAHKDPDDPHREPHLVAYVVPDRADAALPEQLRGHLADLLPRAMVPAEFITLDRIPTTPNGKTDRAALPAPSFARDVPAAPAEAPRTDTERALQEAWSTVLDRPVAGVHQDFFALGGTSLKLLRLFSLLEERFPGAFRVAQLFTHPTIATQARLVEPAPQHTEDEVSEHDF